MNRNVQRRKDKKHVTSPTWSSDSFAKISMSFGFACWPRCPSNSLMHASAREESSIEYLSLSFLGGYSPCHHTRDGTRPTTLSSLRCSSRYTIPFYCQWHMHKQTIKHARRISNRIYIISNLTKLVSLIIAYLILLFGRRSKEEVALGLLLGLLVPGTRLDSKRVILTTIFLLVEEVNFIDESERNRSQIFFGFLFRILKRIVVSRIFAKRVRSRRLFCNGKECRMNPQQSNGQTNQTVN